MRFEDNVAMVTGAGRGIGFKIAQALAREGAKVVVWDVDEEPANEAARSLAEQGAQTIPWVGSVTDRASIEDGVESTLQKWGRIDILINNAGIVRTGMITKMTPEQWDQVMAVNLTGVFNCMQIVGRVFVDRAKSSPHPTSNGKVVNITSIAGLRGTVGQANYGAAKAGVVGLTMSAAREWGRYLVQVNAVAFGVVETRMTEVIRTDERFAEKYRSQIALGRFAKPEEVVPAVLFFASPDADYITGQTLSVCGGLHIG